MIFLSQPRKSWFFENFDKKPPNKFEENKRLLQYFDKTSLALFRVAVSGISIL